ncbi:MAG: hypothetical protein PHU14_12770 [Methylovulum sp.]|nr:hypothetical protein [Methylovulum sp.]
MEINNFIQTVAVDINPYFIYGITQASFAVAIYAVAIYKGRIWLDWRKKLAGQLDEVQVSGELSARRVASCGSKSG